MCLHDVGAFTYLLEDNWVKLCQRDLRLELEVSVHKCMKKCWLSGVNCARAHARVQVTQFSLHSTVALHCNLFVKDAQLMAINELQEEAEYASRILWSIVVGVLVTAIAMLLYLAWTVIIQTVKDCFMCICKTLKSCCTSMCCPFNRNKNNQPTTTHTDIELGNGTNVNASSSTLRSSQMLGIQLHGAALVQEEAMYRDGLKGGY